MPEAPHFTAAAKRKGSYQLPAEFDGSVNSAILWQSVRSYLNNQRQGTHSTLTRAQVSGGNPKPWKQKGTGRARQGSTRAPHWPGGGVAFGPTPRSHRTDLPRKVRRGARLSALNARANDGQLYVIETLGFAEPKTKRLAELLVGLRLEGRKVCVLTADHQPNVYLSGRNLPLVRVLRYAEVPAYDVLWADALVIEEAALGGQAVADADESSHQARRVRKARAAPAKPAKAARKPAARAGKAAKKKITKAAGKKKGEGK